MNQNLYKTGWTIACYSTLAAGVFSLFGLFSSIFAILTAISLAGVGYGFLSASNELDKAGNESATAMKSSAITMFIVSGMYLVAGILYATTHSSLSGIAITIALAGMLFIAAAVFLFIYKGKLISGLRHLNIMNSLFGIGIMLFAICLCVVGFGYFLLGIAPGKGTAGICGVLTILGGIGQLVGAVLWIIGMFQITSAATKQ